MAEIQKGTTFNYGDLVEPADLNNLVDAATALKGIVMDQPSTAPVQADDSVVFYDLSTDNLARCKISALPNGVTSIDLTAIPTSVFKPTGGPITTTGTLNVELKDQTVNKVLVGPESGSANTPSFRKLVPADITPPTVLITATDIDWTLGNVFCRTLIDGSGFTTFVLKNPGDGQTIKVRVRQNAAGNGRVNWNPQTLTLDWAEGAEPELATVGYAYGIYVFTMVRQGGVNRIHGYLESDIGTTSTATFPNQAANKFYAGPESGAAHAPTFRAIVPPDTSRLIALGGGVDVDLTLGNAFWKVLTTAAPTLNFTTDTGTLGQQFKVWVRQKTGTATTLSWTAGGGTILWPGGTQPVLTAVPDAIDVFEFFCTGPNTFDGIRWGANFS